MQCTAQLENHSRNAYTLQRLSNSNKFTIERHNQNSSLISGKTDTATDPRRDKQHDAMQKKYLTTDSTQICSDIHMWMIQHTSCSIKRPKDSHHSIRNTVKLRPLYEVCYIQIRLPVWISPSHVDGLLSTVSCRTDNRLFFPRLIVVIMATLVSKSSADLLRFSDMIKTMPSWNLNQLCQQCQQFIDWWDAHLAFY